MAIDQSMANKFRRGKFRDEHRVIGPSLDEIERAYAILVALPESDSATFFTLDAHKAAWQSGAHDEATWHLFWDAYNWLKFFWWTTAFKARQLGEGLVFSYNADNHLTWLVLARASLEYAAVGYYFAKKIKALRLQGPSFEVSQLKALEDVMLQYSHGTRFDWAALVAGDRERLMADFAPTEASRAVNVVTALDHLRRRDERYKDIEIAYDMLSDFAHPNMASHSAVVELPAKRADLHEAKLAVHPGALRGEFLAVVTLPWVSMGLATTVEMLVELAPLLERWLGHVDRRDRITIDLTR